MRRKRVAVFLICGALCLCGALGLTVYNVLDEWRAAKDVSLYVQELEAVIPRKDESEQLLVPQQTNVMTTLDFGDGDFIGLLEIPSLELSLPVQSSWDYAKLKHSPCLYEGSLYEGMIIAGHNYKSHFGGISKLTPGSEVRFTDGDGNVWTYHVVSVEVLDGYDVEGMEAGDWDLTLFTCTYSGQSRYAVRCEMQIL